MADALPAPSTPTTPVFPPDQTISSLTASLENIQRRVGSTSSWPPPLPNEASSSTHSCGSGSDIRWEDEKRELEGQLMYCARIGQELLERHESFVAGAEDKEQTFKAAVRVAEERTSTSFFPPSRDFLPCTCLSILRVRQERRLVESRQE
jgi:hypothetical protein